MNNTVPSTLDKISAASNGFSAALGAMLREVEDAEKQAADIEEFGRQHRSVQLD